jgi:hypothetical protein
MKMIMTLFRFSMRATVFGLIVAGASYFGYQALPLEAKDAVMNTNIVGGVSNAGSKITSLVSNEKTATPLAYLFIFAAGFFARGKWGAVKSRLATSFFGWVRKGIDMADQSRIDASRQA